MGGAHTKSPALWNSDEQGLVFPCVIYEEVSILRIHMIVLTLMLYEGCKYSSYVCALSTVSKSVVEVYYENCDLFRL